ncbi:MAG: sulfite exporter TauE/SafE family protein [Thiohalorhabdus sp.]|uniref:sulfite exporter TauE/SafE family protein n=1 Tax=Thiohalorhabdus sp. TaxID=3094134 RepID=UPI0039817F6F
MVALAVAAVFVLALAFSLLGLGGGVLYVPLLDGLGYDFKRVAIPTALLLNGLTTLSAAVAHARAGLVDWRGGLPMASTSLAAAPLGALGTRYLATETLVLLFALGLVAAGSRMLAAAGRAEPEALLPAGRRAILTAAAGLGVGAVAGLLGIGGGFLVLPLLLAVGYPTKQAVATSAFIVVFASFSGFAGHVAVGHLHWLLLVGTGLAAVAGAQLGARLMRERMRPSWVKRAFGLLLLGVAARMVWPVLTTG